MTPHNIFISALGDFFSPRVLLITLFSFILTIAIFVLGIALLFGSVETLASWFVSTMDGLNQSIEQSWFLSLISLFFITKMIVTVLFFFTSAFIVYILFLIIFSTIVGFFSGYFIKEIGTKYYPEVEQKGMNFLAYLYILIKTIVVAVLLFIVLLPLALLPVVNLLLFVPIFYMFHKMLVLEVASALMNMQEYTLLKTRKSIELKGISIVCFFLTMIPFFGVVIYPYYVIVMSHFIFRETKNLRLL
ncbi:MAG: EI24 domain-containing protein [Sulfurospirillaceae bacterium]|nr:EI24 domain-containing protein [Sulfurospirillaceae bacterium]MDD2827581.1 EI24 domain-containing protein [Sulfurospirillaceae bacterium]